MYNKRMYNMYRRSAENIENIMNKFLLFFKKYKPRSA